MKLLYQQVFIPKVYHREWFHLMPSHICVQKCIYIFLLLNVIQIQIIHSYLIFANRKDIRKLEDDFIYQKKEYNTTIIIDQLEDATAIDFDYANNLIFWTDLGFETIRGLNLFDGRIFEVVNTGIESPESLACDWITKKLYWVDSETNHIDVCNYDGTHRTVLFWKDLDLPRTIVLVPSEGIMFWSDWGEIPKIERASMNGDPITREVIIKKDILWPNGLTVDYENKRLYFADAKLNHIKSVDFDGQNQETIILNVPQIFALTLSGNILFWTEMQNTNNAKNNHLHRYGIHYCNKTTGVIGPPYYGSHHYYHSLLPLGLTVFDSSRQPRSANLCDKQNGGCSHLCLLSSADPSHYSCACPTGVKLMDDGKTCRSSEEKFLLLARRLDIRRISLDTTDYTPVVLSIPNMKHAVTLDYDWVEGKVYWTDDELHVIKRSQLNGSQYETIISGELMYPDGIAIDWISRNIYWTDPAIDRIEVSRLDGTSRKTLIREGIDKPRAIVVHPVNGLLFWTDWGTVPKIERAALDGSDRLIIISSNLTWPNGLAIDYELSHIYWCDAKTRTIERAKFDGSDRKEIATVERSHMFGLTLIDEWIYWTDWTLRTVERAHKMTGKAKEIIIENLPDLMGIKAVTSIQPEGTNPCATNNGNCSHLCFNRPQQQYICSCPNGYELDAENPLKTTCVKSEFYLLLLMNKNALNRISFKTREMKQVAVLNGFNVTAFDLDIATNIFYWIDSKNKTINRSFINETTFEVIVQIGLGTPHDLSLDWISKNLYWIDIEFKRIEVSRSDGSFRRVIYHDRNRHPYALVVNPNDAFLFWSDWSANGKIVFSYLDGTKRRTLVDSVGRAISLTLDHHERRIYWISDFNKIMSVSYNGSSKITYTVPEGNSVRLSNIVVHDDTIYLLDLYSNNVEFVNKTTSSLRQTNSDVSLLFNDEKFSTVTDMFVYHSSEQRGWNLCADNNGECGQLCFSKPVQKHSTFDSQCGCAAHYMIDPRDNKQCLPPENFLLFSLKNSMARFLFESDKTKGEFQDIVLPAQSSRNIKSLAYDQIDHNIYWIDGKTIKRSYVSGSRIEIVHQYNIQPIDLVIDPYARLLFWTCNITHSINVTRIIGKPITFVGAVHQSSQDQPNLLAYHYRTNSLFWTNHSTQMRIEKIMFPGIKKFSVITDKLKDVIAIAVDQELDYLIWFDILQNKIEYSNLNGYSRQTLHQEENFFSVSIAAFSRHLFWIEKDRKFIEKLPLDLNHGNNKQSIAISRHLSDKQDYLTDIVAVVQIKKNSSYLYCNNENGGCSHFCFITNYLNFNEMMKCDCPIGLILNDEKKCVDRIECRTDEWQCRSGDRCIRASFRCDGVVQCQDGSDEIDCPKCSPNQISCFTKDLVCLNRSHRCNGISDCLGGTDEVCCGNDEFQCKSNNCIAVYQLCDFKKDCFDGEDEDPSNCLKINSSPPPQSTSTSNVSSKSFSFFFLIIIFIFVLSVFLYCQCKKYGHNENKELNVGANEILMNDRSGNIHANTIHGDSKRSNIGFNLNKNKLDCNTLTTATTILSGIDTLTHDNIHLTSNTKNASANHSLACQTTMQSDSLIERNVTGASSTSSSANITYPKETINPPPSPATERSHSSTLSSSLFVPRSRLRNKEKSSVFQTAKSRQKKTHKKNKWNKTSLNRGPPPTPCSTDVYEELEPCSVKYVFYECSLFSSLDKT